MKNKSYKWLLILLMFVISLVTFIECGKIDNDTWYILNEGRYILEHGIYHIDPISMHEGFHIIVQNYLSAIIFYVIFNVFKETGLLIMVLLCNLVIFYLLYKICDLISDGKKYLSILIAFICDISLTFFYIVSRPQIFSFIVLLLVIYTLEKYIKTGNKKVLITLPILSIIEINMHASLWWMIFLLSLPYIIDGLNIKSINTQKYNIKPILLALLISFICGLLNPYTYENIIFIFTSFSDKYMHDFISELMPYTFTMNIFNVKFYLYAYALITSVIYIYFRKGNIRIRYICLYIGTLTLFMISVKGGQHFILFSLFPMAYFFKDMKELSLDDKTKSLMNTFIKTLAILSIVPFTVMLIDSSKSYRFDNKMDNAISFLKEYTNNKSAIVYSSFNDGGFIEYYGYKPYIDPRAEVFLKVNNHKEDIFKEYYELQHNRINSTDFLNKYRFDYLFINPQDKLYGRIYTGLYEKIYEDDNYTIYARNDLVKE